MPRTRVGFWLLVVVVAMIGASKSVLSDTLDADLFWHLRVAEQLRSDGIGPIVDRISFASIKQPWTPYSWLAELFMEGLWRTFGWQSAVAMEALLTIGIVLMIARCCLERAGDERYMGAGVATAIGSYFVIPYLAFRPITFAIFLLSVCMWLLLRDRRRRTRAAWMLVPLTVLLANVHLVAVIVPLWVACVLLNAIHARRDVRRHALLLALTMLACLATPMLPGAIRTGWHYLASDPMVAAGGIAELRPIYHGIGGMIAVALTMLVIACAVVRRQQLNTADWLWLAAGAVLMSRMNRFAPVFALAAAPVLAATMPRLPDRILARPGIAAALGLALIVSIVRVAIGFPFRTPLHQWLRGHPVAAVEFVDQNVPPRSGRIINEFNHGGYLAWRLGDRFQVLLDGRTQLYTAEFWRRTYLGSDANAAALLAQTNADVAIIPVRDSRFRKPLESLGWRSVHRDDVAEVLLPPGGAYR